MASENGITWTEMDGSEHHSGGFFGGLLAGIVGVAIGYPMVEAGEKLMQAIQEELGDKLVSGETYQFTDEDRVRVAERLRQR